MRDRLAIFFVIVVILLFACAYWDESLVKAESTKPVTPHAIAGCTYLPDQRRLLVITPSGDIYERSTWMDDAPRLVGNFWEARALRYQQR